MPETAELHALFVRLPKDLILSLDNYAVDHHYKTRKAALVAILTKALVEAMHETA